MVISPISMVVLSVLCLLVAAVYATVGLGGGTGYLAVMTLLGMPQTVLPSTALALNFVVTGSATIRYGYMGRLDRRLFLPFLLPAVSSAFVGGMLEGEASLFLAILAATFVVAAIAMLRTARRSSARIVEPSAIIRWFVGTLFGVIFALVSGFVGIGGGVFLGPTLLLLRWVGPKQVAPMNSAFILILSASGLLAHGIRGSVRLPLLLPLSVAVFVGGLVGLHVGETRLSPPALQRIFAVVVLVAAIKALWVALP